MDQCPAHVTQFELQDMGIDKTFDQWTLSKRELLNPDSLGHLRSILNWFHSMKPSGRQVILPKSSQETALNVSVHLWRNTVLPRVDKCLL